ncbi:glycosyltransferase family 39 protein [Mycobacterium sp. DL592]|uniref:ArnT family glycosyltransferase n=1 Tax=Mycobacterium sp. DL592 TaxID=2675524 RepID=UPI001FBB0FE9|nr:glycosyltransferase family 39 protein [Mycobacterium sp. DL592]
MPKPHRFRLSRTAWRRIGLAGLLIATAVTYLFNITINGMGNAFYAGAAQAGSKNWEALLFGSVDPGNFITVDKPPVSQWVMGLSGQIFGFSSASMLVPEALMAVAAVALLYGAVRRIAGTGAGFLAGAAFALTPVVALMFRYNNPDAVMVLLMLAAAYCGVRALERGSLKWMMLAGSALGFAFLAKMLEGLMVAPAIGLAYLLVAPTSVRRRLAHLAAAVGACLLSAGWFVAVTLLWPASSRPYLAGSTDNNFMNLVIGYNGLARVLGRGNAGATDAHAGPPAGFDQHSGAAGITGSGHQNPGLTRLFSGEFGIEMSWLLPAALLGLIFVLVVRAHAPRTDLLRGGALLFGGWLLVDGLVLSYMKGMAHPYYCLSVVPAVAALAAIGGGEMWRTRDRLFGRISLAANVLLTALWSWRLLDGNLHWASVMRWVVVIAGVAAAVMLLAAPRANRGRLAAAALTLGIIASGMGSAAYALATIEVPHTGGMAQVGPAQPAHDGGDRPDRGGQESNAQLDGLLAGTDTKWSAAVNGSSAAAALELATNTSVMAIGGFGGNDPVPSLTQFQAYVANHEIGYYVTSPGSQQGPGRGNQHADITAWVAANFAAKAVGSATVYDLTAPLKP